MDAAACSRVLANGIMSMLREELAAEAIVRQMPSLSREEFSRRMKCLGNHPEGRIAQAYACFLSFVGNHRVLRRTCIGRKRQRLFAKHCKRKNG